jgi:hypothetical protein
MSTRILGPTGSKRRKRFLLVPTILLALGVLGALVAGGSVLAAPSTDASVSNYQQCANGAPGSLTASTDCVPQGWINGILNAQNSQYHEDQVTAQRLGIDLPSGGVLTGRTITLKYLARKGQGGVGNHAYDSLATWNVTETAADRCQGLTAANCPGGSPTTYLIPSDTTVVADSNGAGTSTAGHQLPDAQRLMTMFGGTITNVSAPAHDNAAGSGDDYAQVTVTYSVASTPTKVQLLFGGHLAASSGSRGWGVNVGASFINGGPYHIKLVQIDTSSIGNRDNQITSGAILPQATSTATTLHETNSAGVDVSPANNGDPISVDAGAYVTDVATMTPSDSTGNVTFRYYSTSTACTGDTNGTGGTGAGSNIAVSSGSATSSTVQFSTSGTFYWRAFFTGTGNSVSSSSSCEVLNVRQPTTTTTTLHETDSSGVDVIPSNNAVAITILPGAYVTDYASVSPSSAAGSVAFKYYSSLNDCNNDTSGTSAGGGSLSSGSANSTATQFSSAGTFYWRAFFTGTGLNKDSSSACNEILTVQKASPTLGTAPTLRPQDSATLSGIVSGGSGTMSLSFKLFGPGNPTCDPAGDAAVFSTSINVTADGTVTTTNSTFILNSSSATGVYRWLVDFTGNTKNNSNPGTCGDESFDFQGIVDRTAS